MLAIAMPIKLSDARPLGCVYVFYQLVYAWCMSSQCILVLCKLHWWQAEQPVYRMHTVTEHGKLDVLSDYVSNMSRQNKSKLVTDQLGQ